MANVFILELACALLLGDGTCAGLTGFEYGSILNNSKFLFPSCLGVGLMQFCTKSVSRKADKIAIIQRIVCQNLPVGPKGSSVENVVLYCQFGFYVLLDILCGFLRKRRACFLKAHSPRDRLGLDIEYLCEIKSSPTST